MQTIGVRLVVQRLVDEYPDKAVDILVRCCQDGNIETEIMTLFLLPGVHSSGMQHRSLDTTTDVRPRGRLGPTPPVHSDHYGPTIDRQSLSARTPPAAGPRPPPSPTRTVSSQAKSLVSKDGTENILIITSTEDDRVEELPVRMRPAQTGYSVISKHIVDERIHNPTIVQGPTERISLPGSGLVGTARDVLVDSYAKLTWRRPGSDSTHSTKFHIVAKQTLDIDVLLGSLDYGPSIAETIAPQPLRGQRLNFQGHDMRPPAPTPPVPSFHRSSMPFDDATDIVPVQPHDILHTFLNNQHEHRASMADSSFSQRSLGQTQIPDTRSPHTTHPQLQRPPFSPGPSSTNVHQPASPDKVRLHCMWASTSMNIWLDLHAPSEMFIDNVRREFVKRKREFDRATITIIMKTEKQTPDNGAYHLALNEEDFEADWETTVEWVIANRRKQPPHIFGELALDED